MKNTILASLVLALSFATTAAMASPKSGAPKAKAVKVAKRAAPPKKMSCCGTACCDGGACCPAPAPSKKAK